MENIFRRAAMVLVFFCLLVHSNVYALEEDTLLRLDSFRASIEDMSEPELNLLLDSLFDAPNADPDLFAFIRLRADALHALSPKNQFAGGFSLYPGNRFYGVWDTQHIFPYSDSLYKSDTATHLDLSPTISGDFYFPFPGLVTSRYGWRDSAFHRGIDIDLNRGDSVHAAFTGMVRFAGRSGGFGNVVIVRHYNGLETVYAHLWKINVKPGDIVISGQLLGLGGSTGHSTGTHLHFEVRFRGVAINPEFFIDLENRTLLTFQVRLIRNKQGYGVRPENIVYHYVVRGDTPSKIAQRYGIALRDLKMWNGWTSSIRLRKGQAVRIQPPEITASR